MCSIVFILLFLENSIVFRRMFFKTPFTTNFTVILQHSLNRQQPLHKPTTYTQQHHRSRPYTFNNNTSFLFSDTQTNVRNHQDDQDNHQDDQDNYQDGQDNHVLLSPEQGTPTLVPQERPLFQPRLASRPPSRPPRDAQGGDLSRIPAHLDGPVWSAPKRAQGYLARHR